MAGLVLKHHLQDPVLNVTSPKHRFDEGNSKTASEETKARQICARAKICNVQRRSHPGSGEAVAGVGRRGGGMMS